eukprot:jgi/Picsp_1/3713/NSC_06549-R1_regulator of nonsense transcripts 1
MASVSQGAIVCPGAPNEATVPSGDSSDDGEFVDKELPDWACSYCGIYDPATVAKCIASGKWFCNGRTLGKISCIVHHALKSRCREFSLHTSNPLGGIVLHCQATGNRDILALGFAPGPMDEKVIVSRDFLDLDIKISGLTFDESKWQPLIQDRALIDWVVKHPSQKEMKRCKKPSPSLINRLEDIWRSGNDDVKVSDLVNFVPLKREEILPVAKHYQDDRMYQSIFNKLIDLEKRTNFYRKKHHRLTNVQIKWSQSNGSFATFSHRDAAAEYKVVVGDEILIKYPKLSSGQSARELTGKIIKYNYNSGLVTAEISSLSEASHQNNLNGQPMSVEDGYSIEFVWQGAPYDRMKDAFDIFAADKHCLSENLRQIILGNEDKAIPPVNLEAKLPEDLSVPGVKMLNLSQQKAVSQTLNCSLTLIQGPPGTGKTTTAATIIYHLVKQKNGQVLVTTPSNTAADNIAERIARTGVRVVRMLSRSREEIGSSVDHLTVLSQVLKLKHPLVAKFQQLYHERKYSGRLQRSAERKFRENRKVLEQMVLSSADVICCTCVSAGDIRLRNLKFKTVLIDEATQSSESETLIPIVKGCEKLILVGDQCQLGPVILNRRALRSGLGESLFERLMFLGMTPIRLNTQYRMHPSISLFPSNMFYEGDLQNGVSAIERTSSVKFPWPRPETPIMFWAQSSGIEEIASTGISYLNRTESNSIEIIITRLLELEVKPSTIGVITPYEGQRAQVVSILSKVGALRNMAHAEIEVSSVDSFQGREKDYIILSCVRSNKLQGLGFLSDPKRLNVSLTRARYGLIIVGNPQLLSRDSLWSRLLSHYSEKRVFVEGPLDSLRPITFIPRQEMNVESLSMTRFCPVQHSGDPLNTNVDGEESNEVI